MYTLADHLFAGDGAACGLQCLHSCCLHSSARNMNSSQSLPNGLPSLSVRPNSHAGLRIVSDSTRDIKHKGLKLMRLKGSVNKMEQDEAKALSRAAIAERTLKKNAAMRRKRRQISEGLHSEREKKAETLREKSKRAAAIRKENREASKNAEAVVRIFVLAKSKTPSPLLW